MTHQDLAAFGGVDLGYAADLFLRYLSDPNSVDPSWASLFAALGDEGKAVLAEQAGASWAPPLPPLVSDAPAAPAADAGKGKAADAGKGKAVDAGKGNTADAGKGKAADAGKGKQEAEAKPSAAAPAKPDPEAGRAAAMDSIRALMLIRAFRVRGHLHADLDPLKLKEPGSHPELDHRSYGFSDADLDRPIVLDNVLGLATPTLRQILDRARAVYCGRIGVEYMHIQDPEQKDWIQRRIEGSDNRTVFTPARQKALLESLIRAEGFENFLHTKHQGTKRFGLDGGEATIPVLEEILETGVGLGVEEFVIGMAHRGRLNVLATVMGKPYVAIFSEFAGVPSMPESVQGSGDVKYHMGTSSDREVAGKMLHLSLTPNPSHLEAVNPVVLGKVRAKQRQKDDIPARQKVAGILIHGDAAFAGQGLVAETLALSELRGYRTGGTLHLIINNQIGFTTSPADARSGPHPTDVALMVQAPVFHINGDDPEACVHVARIAMEFRQRFSKDVVIDIVCYRRFGHNEGDEPRFTQPLMYERIAKQKSTRAIYAETLAAQRVLTAEEAEAMRQAFLDRLAEDFEAAKTYRPNKADWLEGAWTGLKAAPGGDRRGSTAVEPALITRVGERLLDLPPSFTLNAKLKRQFQDKAEMLRGERGLDWATAEALAFGTLLLEGNSVRLSGQDVGRGTFSQRHAALYDQVTGEKYVPLANLAPDQPLFEVIDSPLSEAAVMGFDYGYASADPSCLVLWEGQFGDFVNGAQVIIDQFLSSAESKWLRMNGLVLLLPHGFEGQGPEHSSARLERFLQLCAEDNIQVAYPSTPASYFHILRRQLRREFRKPLVLMTPKSLLRLPDCVSTLQEFTTGSSFHRVLWDPQMPEGSAEVRRVVLSAGKVFYDLAKERAARKQSDVALLRLEQFYPFPAEPIATELAKFPNATEVVWAQEEPENMGAWTFLDRRIESVLTGMKHACTRPRYVGRPEAASPATGLYSRHVQEQQTLIEQALGPQQK